MRKRIFTGAVCAFAIVTLACAEAPIDPAKAERVEPPLELEVRIGGQKLIIANDSQAAFTVDGKPVSVHVAVQPTRQLRTAHIRFRYARHFAFAFDSSSPDAMQWTLDGNNVVIMLTRLDAAQPPEFLEGFIHDVARSVNSTEKPKIEQIELKLGGAAYKGMAGTISIGAAKLRYEAFMIAVNGTSHMLVLQDSPTPDGKHTDEYAESVKLLSESWQR